MPPIGDCACRGSLEGQDLDGLLRSLGSQSCSVEERAGSALGGPLLARAEVVDVAELDVRHGRALGHGEREREERDPALRVHRAVDRVDDHSALSSCAERAHTKLLRDEHEVLAEGGQPGDDGVLSSLIDRGRIVATLAELQDGLALDPGRHPVEHVADVRDAEPAGLEPGRHRSSGWKRSPESGLGKK